MNWNGSKENTVVVDDDDDDVAQKFISFFLFCFSFRSNFFELVRINLLWAFGYRENESSWLIMCDTVKRTKKNLIYVPPFVFVIERMMNFRMMNFFYLNSNLKPTDTADFIEVVLHSKISEKNVK